MLALHQIRTAQPTQAQTRPVSARPRPRQQGFTDPMQRARFVQGMAGKGSTPEGIAWFLGGDS